MLKVEFTQAISMGDIARRFQVSDFNLVKVSTYLGYKFQIARDRNFSIEAISPSGAISGQGKYTVEIAL
jgi:hypothetical protein